MHADSLGGQQVVLSTTTGVKVAVKSFNVAVDPGSSAGAASAVSCWTFSPAPMFQVFLWKYMEYVW